MRTSFFLPALLCISSLCLAQNQERIITAGSAATETICALGDCNKIVASDKTSLYPESIQSLPSIGYRTSIGAEGILSLKPTLVVAIRDYVDEAVLTQVKSAGVRVVVIERLYNFDGTKTLIRTIAETLQRKPEGEKLITKIEEQLAQASVILKKAKTSPRVLCIYNRGTSSFDVAGDKTFSSILPYVGARSAVTGVEGYKPLNTEALIAANPDYLLMFEAGVQSLGGVEGVLRVPGVMQTNAGKNKKVIAMDGMKLSNFGPRFGETVKELTIILYPDIQAN